MISAIAAREREITEVRAPVRLNRCSLYFVPPHKIDSPSTSRMLPIIEPAIDALTTPLRPFESAITAMMSSAAFPNVAFNNPPAPSPIRAANTSVARPIHPASGIMPMAEQMKSAVGFSAPGQNRNTIAIGTIKRSQESDGFKFTINSGWIADPKFELGAPPAGAVQRKPLACLLYDSEVSQSRQCEGSARTPLVPSD